MIQSSVKRIKKINVVYRSTYFTPLFSFMPYNKFKGKVSRKTKGNRVDKLALLQAQ